MASKALPSGGNPDWDIPLSKLSRGQDGHKLLSAASSFIHRGGGPQASYLSKLKFLAPLQTKVHLTTPLDGILDPFSDCVCANYMPFTAADYLSEMPSLLLTDSGALMGCKHYIAISYCWQQSEQDQKYDPGVPAPDGYRIHTSGGIRANRAPASVIHRALIYAAAYGYRFLWIDQESINQDDMAEKSEAVQHMNLIYRQAVQTVAILSNPFMDQTHVDTIGRIGVTKGMHRTSITLPEDFRILQKSAIKFSKEHPPEHSLFTESRSPREGLRSVIECAEIITSDPWHSRAWTLQETLVAGGPLHFLIPCHQALERPSWMISHTPGNIVLSESFIQLCMGFRLPQYYEKGDAEFEELRERGLKCAALLFRCPEYKLNGDIVRRPDLARLSAADACKMFIHQGLLDRFDLLAIIGNVCQYNTRLDINRIRDAGISLSICLWAQSLLNGDMSLLMALNAKGIMYQTTSPFEFCRLTDSIAEALAGSGVNGEPDVNNPGSWICRIKPMRVSPTGLQVAGTLWRFNSYLDFSDMLGMEELYRKREGRSPDCRDPFFADALWAILAYLYSLDLPHLVKAILRLYQPSSAADISDKDLQRIFDEQQPGGWSTDENQFHIYDSRHSICKIVDMVMKNRKLALGVMESDAGKCSTHQPAYILFDHQTPLPLLVVPNRDLVMSESDSDMPSFLFTCWVEKSERQGTPGFDLQLLDFPRKLDLVGTFNRSDTFSSRVLVCGSRRHFSSCAGEEYNLLWKPEPSY